jgi:hypothetical protein
VRTRVDKILADLTAKESPVPRALRATARARYGADHRDMDVVDPIAIPMVILGLKYDLFRNLEPADRKAVCKVIRFRAHAAGAAVLYHSDADDAIPGYAIGMGKCVYRLRSPLPVWVDWVTWHEK